MKNIVYYIAIATVLLFASCASELDTEPSGSQVSDEQLGELIKENADLVLAPMMQGAVNDMHTGNRRATTNDRGFMVWNLGMDLQGNDMVLTKLTNWFADEYMFESIRAQTNAYTADRWYCYYKIVYQSNQILDLIPDDATGKALVYKAQALTYRALAYYYLMCVYQDDYMHGGKDKAGVPLYLTVEDAKGRTPVDRGLQHDHDRFAERHRAVRAGRLRSQEFDGGHRPDGCEHGAGSRGTDDGRLHHGSQCCRGGDFGRLLAHERGAVYDFGFPEHLASRDHLGLHVAASTSLGNRSFASFMSITAVDNANNKGIYMAIDDQLYNQIAATDYRKKNFNATETTVGVFTYPAYSNVKFNTDYEADEIYMRLSEAYLLKAEAEARGGNSSAAQQTLYDLVSKRDSGYAKSSNTAKHC